MRSSIHAVAERAWGEWRARREWGSELGRSGGRNGVGVGVETGVHIIVDDPAGVVNGIKNRPLTAKMPEIAVNGLSNLPLTTPGGQDTGRGRETPGGRDTERPGETGTPGHRDTGTLGGREADIIQRSDDHQDDS